MQKNGADNSQLNGFLDGVRPGKSDAAKASDGMEAEVFFQTDYSSLIAEALESSRSDTDAVERANELLASGGLDSPESAHIAAENILKSGI